MRWDNLFDDLEGQLEYELGAEAVDLKAEEERLRLGRISLRDRLVSISAARGRESDYRISLRLRTDVMIALRPATFGRDWLAGDLLDSAHQQAQCVVPLAAICGVDLNGQQVEASLELRPPASGAPGRLIDRITLAFVLRDLCRRRSGVELWLDDGTVHGTIDRVGRDHFDLAIHDQTEPRRNISRYRLVAFDAVLLVKM